MCEMPCSRGGHRTDGSSARQATLVRGSGYTVDDELFWIPCLALGVCRRHRTACAVSRAPRRRSAVQEEETRLYRTHRCRSPAIPWPFPCSQRGRTSSCPSSWCLGCSLPCPRRRWLLPRLQSSGATSVSCHTRRVAVQEVQRERTQRARMERLCGVCQVLLANLHPAYEGVRGSRQCSPPVRLRTTQAHRTCLTAQSLGRLPGRCAWRWSTWRMDGEHRRV